MTGHVSGDVPGGCPADSTGQDRTDSGLSTVSGVRLPEKGQQDNDLSHRTQKEPSGRVSSKARARRLPLKVIDPESPRGHAIEAKLARMPANGRGTYRLAAEGRSLRAAVKAFCHGCVGWQRREVTPCTSLGCPLWAVRPFQRREEGQDGPSLALERDGEASDEAQAGTSV